MPPLRLRHGVLAAMVLATLATVGWWRFGPTGVAVELTRRSWRMEVVVERLRAETGSDWCDELPAGAFDISRRLAADPRGLREGLHEHCRYGLLAWRRQWIAMTEGGPADRPDWPRPPLRMAPPGQPGGERLGRREAFYEIELRERYTREPRVWTCRVEPAQWQQLRPGQTYRMPVDRFGTADCARLYASKI